MTTKQWHSKLESARNRVRIWVKSGVFLSDPLDTALVKEYYTTHISTQEEWDKRLSGGCSSCNKLARLYRDVKLHIENEYNNL